MDDLDAMVATVDRLLLGTGRQETPRRGGGARTRQRSPGAHRVSVGALLGRVTRHSPHRRRRTAWTERRLERRPRASRRGWIRGLRTPFSTATLSGRVGRHDGGGGVRHESAGKRRLTIRNNRPRRRSVALSSEAVVLMGMPDPSSSGSNLPNGSRHSARMHVPRVGSGAPASGRPSGIPHRASRTSHRPLLGARGEPPAGFTCGWAPGVPATKPARCDPAAQKCGRGPAPRVTRRVPARPDGRRRRQSLRRARPCQLRRASRLRAKGPVGGIEEGTLPCPGRQAQRLPRHRRRSPRSMWIRPRPRCQPSPSGRSPGGRSRPGAWEVPAPPTS